jgi:hypothetical protein
MKTTLDFKEITALILFSIVTLFICGFFMYDTIAHDKPAEQFEALCSTCNFHIENAPALTIKTNRLDPIMMGQGGYTNAIIDVTLACPRCHTTNVYESQIMMHRPTARHILHPPLPLKESPPTIPMTLTNEPIVHLRVPPGFEVRLVPTNSP